MRWGEIIRDVAFWEGATCSCHEFSGLDAVNAALSSFLGVLDVRVGLGVRTHWGNEGAGVPFAGIQYIGIRK